MNMGPKTNLLLPPALSLCTVRACSRHSVCVRAACTVGACVQHGMCTGQTVHTIKSRGVIRCYFLFSLDALPASSNISALKNSNTPATYTGAPLPTLEEYRQFAG